MRKKLSSIFSWAVAAVVVLSVLGLLLQRAGKVEAQAEFPCHVVSADISTAGAFNQGNCTFSTATNRLYIANSSTAATPIGYGTDGSYIVPLGHNCNLTVTTGALGTATAGTINPGMIRVAANNSVLYALTSAAANVVALDCDITPPSNLTSGRGVTLNNAQLFYGVQTTALTSITAPTVSTVTYPATGAAAGATVAGAGGTLTVTPGTLQLATTTSGQCYSENISFGTPINVITDLQRVNIEQLFNQTAAAVTQLQICGVQVHFTRNL